MTAIDPDWNCPRPLDWQRHYAILRDLAAEERGGVLPFIEPECCSRAMIWGRG